MENLKVKRLLKKLFENREFNLSFEDEVYNWNGDYDDVEYEEYSFKFRMFVGDVLGEGSGTVATIKIIIDDIEKDGDDYYYNWVEGNYNDNLWYIDHLRNLVYDEYFSEFPFSIHALFYGYDEKM
jgi:hypothetical protein